jgi:hypothetical protein
MAGNVWQWVSDWHRADYCYQLTLAGGVARNRMDRRRRSTWMSRKKPGKCSASSTGLCRGTNHHDEQSDMVGYRAYLAFASRTDNAARSNGVRTAEPSALVPLSLLI